MYRLPPKAFARHLAAGSPDACAERLHCYAEAGARHIVVMVAGSPAVEHFAAAAGRLRPRRARAGRISVMSGHPTEVAILGTGMTDMSRRDLDPEVMTEQAVGAALADAGLSPSDLGLVIMGNAMGGRLNDQGCVRGQTWLRKLGFGDAAIINVDNSCAGGSSALHLGTMAAGVQDRPVLALGVEKMWTGNRAETIAGIEDGLPTEYRLDLHAQRQTEDNPAGSILMGLNNRWALQLMEETGTTLRQIASAAVKAFDHAARNPLAQCQRSVTVEDVLESPQVAGVLTRLMCSSFTDGAAAIILAGPSLASPASAPRIVGSVARSGNGLIDYHDRLTQTAEAAWEVFGWGAGDVDLVELHDATAAEELFALESLGFFGPRRGRAGHRDRRHPRGLARPGRELERRAGRPGAPAGRHRPGPGRRAGHPDAWPRRRPPGGRATAGRRDQHGRDHLRGCRVRRHPRSPRRDGRVRGIRFTGWGIAVPDKVVTNDDLAVRLDTSDEWIVERTGIRERRVGGTTSGLAIEAAQAAIASAGRTADEIDNLVLATTTPDGLVPGSAPTVQHGIGMRGGAVDLNAACSGFVYGLVAVAGLIAMGSGPVLLIGSETLTRITDMDDRKIAILVGDGAGAVVVEPVDGPGALLSWNLNSDGSLRHLLKCDHGATLYMDGKEVFRRAVRVIVESAERAMAEAGLGPDDISLMVPHQANIRIIQAAGQRLGIPEERTAIVIDRYGNTSSASIPLALNDAIEHGRVHEGDHLLLTGFGGGMTWASAVLRWTT